MNFKEYVNIMGEGYNIDLGDTSNIKQKGSSYYVDMSNNRYIVKFSHIKDNNWILKFGISDNGRDIKDIDMVKGLSISQVKEVMGNVGKSVILFIKKYKPNSLRYDADRKSRQKSYLLLVNTLINHKDMFKYHLEQYNKEIYYILKNDITLDDIIE